MKQFYVGLAGIIEKDGKFLVLKRSPDKDFAPNCWEPVTGRLEEAENPEDGILREIEEEIGIKTKIAMPVDTSFFYRGSKEFPMVFIVFWCKYIDGTVKLGWEHTEYKWITPDEAFDELTLDHFHHMFKRILKLKEHLPTDFIL